MTQDNNFAEGLLKGRMAETLVEELLRKCGNTVYRFGYEAILQNLTQMKSKFDRDSETGERIRAIPDFVVVDVDGNPVLVEVKFRRSGTLHEKDYHRIDLIDKFWGSKVVLVNCFEKPFFRIATPPYLENGVLKWKPLNQETAWKIDPTVYAEYEALVEKYLTLPIQSEQQEEVAKLGDSIDG